MRLTEGETIQNGQPESYDEIEHGRFFDFSRLRGETTLVKMHRDYQVGRDNKRAAYEIAVREGRAETRGVIYVTEYLDVGGLRYFCLKEGYSVLVVMSDKEGRELYGAHVPLQSQMQEGGGHHYATGSAEQAAGFPFPAAPEHPRTELLVTFWPSLQERAGKVGFEVRPLGGKGAPASERKGMVDVGGSFDAGDFALSPREIRYWVGMDVRYDPGLNVIMASLGAGLAGMFLTLFGRLRQGARKKAA
jgi:hypothetical protein